MFQNFEIDNLIDKFIVDRVKGCFQQTIMRCFKAALRDFITNILIKQLWVSLYTDILKLYFNMF